MKLRWLLILWIGGLGTIWPYGVVQANESRCLAEREWLHVFQLSQQEQRPALLPVDQGEASRWVSQGQYFANLLGLKRAPYVMWQVQELRFLPHTLANTSVLLVSRELPLTERQVQKVIAVAKLQKVRLHVLWLGRGDKEQARRLTQQTSGQYFSRENLTPCGPMMQAAL
jgi:hypothetical protein